MSIIAVRNNVKEMLIDEKTKGESFDSVISRLIDASEDMTPYVPTKSSNIRISESTLHKLQELKADGEDYTSLISRLIDAKNKTKSYK